MSFETEFTNFLHKKSILIVENYCVDLDRWYNVVAFSPKKRYFATIFMDISDRKKSEEILQESEERFRKMFTEHDVSLGREGRIIELKREVNKLLKLHGMPRKYNSVEEN